MENPAGRPVVRPVVVGDVPALVDMLVRSFDDDPVAHFMFAGEWRRRRGLHSFFTAQIRRQYLPFGQVYTTEGLGGVGLWGPPDVAKNGLKELLQLLATAPFAVSTRVHRALRLLLELEGLHPKEPHWYLATLGTEPELQGKGIGTALLGSMLDSVDHQGFPAYLESSKERNVTLYARFGFEVIDELHSKVGSPPIWRMWREPRVPDLP